MLRFVVRRLAASVPLVLVASLLVFVFVRATTDPLDRLRETNDPTLVAREQHRLGLDRPLLPQYGRWLADFAQGKWGESLVTRRSVAAEIRQKLWNTLQLVVWAILVAALAAVAFGALSAARYRSPVDHALSGLSLLSIATPSFWFSLLAIQFLVYEPTRAFGLAQPLLFSVGKHSVPAGGPLDYLRHLALPVLVLSFRLFGRWTRYVRSSVLEVSSADYLMTARAKGLPERHVIGQHGLRNALIPFATVAALDIGHLFGGVIVTETIFSWPGMGRLLVDALLAGDTAIVLPWLMVTALFVVGCNLVADVLVGVLNPKARE